MDPTRPYVKTDPRAIEAAKEKYQGVYLEGNVEAEFLYETLLSTDLVPFAHLPFRTVALPILWREDHYAMLDVRQARKEGYLGLAAWLEKCETIWKEKRGQKAERESIYDWLDYRKKLTQQRRKRYTVVYPTNNRVMLAAFMENARQQTVGRDNARPPVIESKLYWFDSDDEREAGFLSAVMNSQAFDSLLEVFRGRRQARAPDIHKKLWEFPVPLFDEKARDHPRLAQLGLECSTVAQSYLDSLPANIREGSLGRLRNMIREKLRPQLDEVDELVRKILRLD
jgi:hypothetical protein